MHINIVAPFTNCTVYYFAKWEKKIYILKFYELVGGTDDATQLSTVAINKCTNKLVSVCVCVCIVRIYLCSLWIALLRRLCKIANTQILLHISLDFCQSVMFKGKHIRRTLWQYFIMIFIPPLPSRFLLFCLPISPICALSINSIFDLWFAIYAGA